MSVDLSIVILTYNQEKYIRHTLDSVISQKSNYTFEVVVADDCSSDNTRNILKEYAKKYKNVQLSLNSTNKGVVKNYIDALDLCKGKYIMECGGDDYWLPNKIMTQMDFMRSHPDVDLSYCRVIYVDSDDNIINKSPLFIENINYEHLIENNTICASSACFKNDTWKKYHNDVKPEEKKWLMEDYPFWLWISKNGRIRSINNIFCAYRILSGSISRQKNIDRMLLYQNSVFDIRCFYASQTNLPQIKRQHYADLANLYFSKNDLKDFRIMCKYEKSLKGYLKYLFSFFPGYFKIRKARKKITNSDF